MIFGFFWFIDINFVIMDINCVIVVWCGDAIDGDFVGVGVFYCI